MTEQGTARSGGATGSAWPGALAIAGFLATLLLVAQGLRFAASAPQVALAVADLREDGEPLPRVLAYYFGTGPYWLAWAVIALICWRRASSASW
ncbi:hypothetical protein [Actinomadura rubrisoli]|uniref:Uncharacterized protein n=1 Tax=Actinomadura rubrisoli TaxID=2530368 RepID=A0A4R5B2M3_9ACTN|nr:hypothetical protein [Actinomadura rubrisoli]TDD80348.1 hypothetical protein E1298_25915 [Actinomadura rubrisoli]